MHLKNHKKHIKQQSTGYSALPSPPRLMRRTHTQRDAKCHNTFLHSLSGSECKNRNILKST